jgi:uncharacterized repeat protein (TIGR04052 family)
MILARRLASKFLLGACLFCCAACSQSRSPVDIEFVATWNGQPLACGDAEYSLTDLRFFVSEAVLVDAAGAEHSISLTSDGRWQQEHVALIDLENGEGACVNGTQETNTRLAGTTDIADFKGIRFTVGVPFELNHANPLLADAPLDDSAMHWHWRSGYKFLRAGVNTESDGFWLHLGSTACEGTVQNISTCRSPNRVTVQLDGFSPQDQRINVDLAALFEGADFNDGVPGDCSSGPSESACAAPFAALGLPFGGDRDLPIQRSVFQVGQ